MDGCAMTEKPCFSEEDPVVLGAEEVASQESVKPLKEARDAFEKIYLTNLLELCGGRVSEAAKIAGKFRADFYDLLRKHSLSPDDFRKTK